SDAATSWVGLIVLIALTWAFFQKTFAGIRHLVMDTGMGFELRSNKTGAIVTIVASVIVTAALWAYWLGVFE
ncbi:MAG: succinate:quinone oxidoreductase subunit C, partial [Pseudomonadota bacterium]|nr:succinate:quinone oxidoreductase subunit C [Pseudomonadota bacterium]